ncbi:MAG TPA: AraC family transcriptional regulator [Gemmatimonadaceae bacterium]|nr:AraC family transcriptional regulator [Gemmatimonadaceae bacterium]
MPRPSEPVTTGGRQLSGIVVDGFRVSEFLLPPLLELPPHYHETACLSVLLDGSVEEAVGPRTLTYARASLFVKPAGERHSNRIGRVGARALAVEPSAARAATLDLSADPLGRVLHSQDPRAAALASAIARELREPDAVSPIAIEGLALELVALAARAVRPGARPRHSGGAPPAWLAAARELLHDRFTTTLRLADVAAAAGVHPAHLSRAFRAHHGASVGEYLRRLRLDWAAARLATSRDSLSAVALGAGFADQSHFTRAFKRYAGVTPERYRRRVRG